MCSENSRVSVVGLPLVRGAFSQDKTMNEKIIISDNLLNILLLIDTILYIEY